MDVNDVTGSTQQAVEIVTDLISTWGIQVVGAIALLLVGRWAAGMVRRGVRRSLEKGNVDHALVPFFSSMGYYLTLTVVIIAVLSLFGVQTTSLVAVLGAASLAVGLALQGTLSSFAAGVMLLIFRPVRIGDFVEVAGQAGSVTELGLFTMLLKTGDNIQIIIPNSSVYGAVIKNYSAHDTRRIDLVMGVSYNDDLGTAKRIIEETLTKEARVLADPAPTIAVSELADSSVNFVVRPWVNSGDYWPTRFDLTRALKENLEAGGCSIPYPQQDLHVVEMPAQATH